MRRAWALFLIVLGAACGPRPLDTDLFSTLKKHEDQRQALCARGREDAVTAVFCRDDPPEVTSIAQLQELMGLPLEGEARAGFSFVAHSSALAGRIVSSINPQSVIVHLPDNMPDKVIPHRDDGNIVTFAFARGEPFIEMAVTPPGGDIHFYLIHYERPCDEEEDGCSTTERFSARTESGWTNLSLYDDVDLANHVTDCLHCHQPDGPNTRRIYRLQELSAPWTHWEATFTQGGRVLLDQTLFAHDQEGTIAGIPGAIASQTDPVTAEDLMRFSQSEQTNVFASHFIEDEVIASNPAQPGDNTSPGESATWDIIYDAAVKGEAIPPPYHDVQVTDRDKLANLTQAIVDFRTGVSDTLPDLSDVFDEDALAGMSHRPKPGLTGEEILVHACAQCHNERLNQQVSRAKFDPKKLDSMSPEQLRLAVERMKLPRADREAMPPKLFRDLSDDELQLAIDALEKR